jgi:hypothetical protein
VSQVVLCSAFRDSAGSQIDRYFAQAAMYRTYLAVHGWSLRVLSVEGDSVDSTREDLGRAAAHHGLNIDVRVCNVGGRRFGSVEDSERFQKLSRVGNAIFEGVHESDDIVTYVESDLVWDPSTFINLGSRVLNNADIDIVAPMPFAGGNFYDVWGFRGLDGSRFAPFAPYHSSMKPSGLTEVSSVGSCLVMRGDVARRCRIIDDECLVGFCRDARNKGYRVWVDAESRVRHL